MTPTTPAPATVVRAFSTDDERIASGAELGSTKLGPFGPFVLVELRN